MKPTCFNRLRRIVPALVLALSIGAVSAQAQTLNLMDVIPGDTTVRTGVLPGGSTYYIKHNDKPENRADFYIYYKVGAVQEQDSQNGLAHFLEHMAFNGSKHFPGTTMRDYLETVGIRFGENLNAWTSQEATSYMITNVPLTRASMVDSVLLVLHDWAGFLTLDHGEIDQERGVIQEEFRTSNSAWRRIWKKQQPTIYGNTVYARRDILGTLEVLGSFKYDELKNFYRKWYRPDLQAFVIVGDFDVDSMEQKLRTVMADVKEFEAKTPKEVVTVPDNDRPLISVESDPELTSTSVQLIFRYPPLPEQLNNRYVAYKMSYLTSLAGSMFNSRMQEIVLKENAPFLNAGLDYGTLIRPTDALYASATAREGEALRAFEALGEQLMRMKKGGFTQSELDRVKTNVLRSAEREYENRNDRKNGEFRNGYIAHFEHNEPYMDPETKLAMVKGIIESITLEEINQVAGAWVQDKNSAFLISLPAKESVPMPAEQELTDAWAKVNAMEIQAYEDGTVATQLMDASKLKGTKVTKTEQGAFGSTVMTLKNGIKVIVKPTKYKTDEIQMHAEQAGGTSQLTDLTDLYNMAILPAYWEYAGVGEFSQTDLRKVMTGKIAGASTYISDLWQGFSGNCSPKDLETLMQLTYLRYTAPRFEQGDWNVMMNQFRSMLPNVITNPDFILSDSLSKTIYGHNPRVFQLYNEQVLNAVSMQRAQELYRQFMSNAAGMTFVFVGSIDPETLKPLAEKYLGSLPVAKHETGRGEHFAFPVEGVVTNQFHTRLETPKVTAVQIYTGRMQHSAKENVVMNAIRYILEMRYTKYIREEKGGTYGVGVGMGYNVLPEPRFVFQMSFNTDESKIEELLPMIKEQIDLMTVNGVTEEELTKTKEFFVKKHKDNLIQNGTWMDYISEYYRTGTDYYTDYEDIVAGLDSDTVRETAAKAFGQKNICTVVRYPEDSESK